MAERIAVRVAELCEMLSISDTTIYRMLERGELRSVKLGGARLILMESVHAHLNRLANGQEYGSDQSRKSKSLVKNE